MSVAEVGHRVRQKSMDILQRIGFGLARQRMAAGHAGNPWTQLPKNVDVTPYLVAADGILAGQFSVFSLRHLDLGFPPQWNRCPKTGVLAPLTFGKSLNYRDESLVGDIKYLWEPSRHLELVTLAQAWHLSGDHRYAQGARDLVDSWIDQCPYPNGPHWTSSLEHSVRLVNWAVAWHLLGGEQSPLFEGESGKAFRERWVQSIYQHCHFISGHFSRYSSANNHLLGELMGLFIGALTWPLWPESKRWRDRAARELEVEALRQNAADGVNREQAFWYHHEVADMMLLCLMFARGNGVDFSADFTARLEAMMEFIAAVMDASGNVPMVGDSDDAVMVRFSREQGFNPYRSLLATAAVLFGRVDFARKARSTDDKTLWLLGDAAAGRLGELVGSCAPTGATRAFPDGGYWVLGDRLDQSDEVRVVADAGPLGYLSIAAHGHADALAFTLSAAGTELLVDPGTFAYHTQKQWRDYFRGTAAHNTVRIDGCDQSVIGGNFMWNAHAAARCHEFASNDRVDAWEASHDGYQRLPDPVTHRRRLRLDKVAGLLEVTDKLVCNSRHQVEIFWHFHPECRVQLVDDVVHAESGRASLSLRMVGGSLRARIFRGSSEPMAGWYSPRFDEKQPSTTVVFSGEVEAASTLSTRITLHIATEQQPATCAVQENEGNQ
ncbi:alginate lyase family protein [Lysobacter arenosi]|uniref:Alginate lyase family protein n=1 Tax=Lysobacter arenosi TaxID=2795387 RepID=A0ABX7RD13_9GAMM|nr:alginate lyase family protein [Lysobacter arenosi]QSX76043.1 alginate lyase family protein [Lysobacter arenosi]